MFEPFHPMYKDFAAWEKMQKQGLIGKDGRCLMGNKPELRLGMLCDNVDEEVRKRFEQEHLMLKEK